MKLNTFFRATVLQSEVDEGTESMRDFPVWFANALRVAYGDSIANAGRRVTDEQRKAIFAKRGGGGGGGGGGRSQNSPSTSGGGLPKSTYRSQVASAPATGGKSYSWSIAAPGGLAEAQAQNAQWLGSQLAAGRTVVPAGGGQITAEATWTPQGGFVPHSPEVLQAMASTRAQIAFNKQVEQQLFERALAEFNGPRATPAVMPRDPGGMVYTGGTPNFDERTGRYIDQPGQRNMTMPIRQPSGGQYDRPGAQTIVPGSTAYLAQMNAGTPAGRYYDQLAKSGVQWDTPQPRLATSSSRAGQSGTSRPQYDKQTGQLVYPGNRITTKPTPPKPAMPAIHEKMNPPKRPARSTATLAKALQRYK